MRKKVILIGAVLACTTAFMACKKQAQKSDEQTTEQTADKASELKVDSVTFDKTWELSDPDLKEIAGGENPGVHCVIDVPSFEQSPVLANAIMEWVSERLGGTYSGDLKDVNAMLTAHVKDLQQGDEGSMGPDVNSEFTIRKIYENAQVVTFLYVGYDYAFGAAHGMPYCEGASFRKSDGKLFGWNMFSSNADLQSCLKSGLSEYFEVKSDSALAECLMMDGVYSVDLLPKPVTQPWISSSGIELLYQSYEVACYAAGQPCVTISKEDALPLLTPAAAKLLQ